MAQIKLIKTSEVVCPGEKIISDFKWDGTIKPYNFRTSYVTTNTVVGGSIWSVDPITFYSLPKKLDGLDTVYTISLSTQSYWPHGIVNFKIQEAPESFNIDINCGPVGIKENVMDEVNPVYYDLNGNVTEPIKGTMLVKKVGNRFSKVLILE